MSNLDPKQMALFPNTDIELGKWYPASQPPPNIRTDEYSQTYDLLLGINGLGVRSGFYDETQGLYYWHCERYDSFDDEDIPGWSREQEINNNLELTYEKARGVSFWMLIPDFDNSVPSYDGTNYYDPDPDQDWTVEEGEDAEEDDFDLDAEDPNNRSHEL